MLIIKSVLISVFSLLVLGFVASYFGPELMGDSRFRNYSVGASVWGVAIYIGTVYYRLAKRRKEERYPEEMKSNSD